MKFLSQCPVEFFTKQRYRIGQLAERGTSHYLSIESFASLNRSENEDDKRDSTCVQM